VTLWAGRAALVLVVAAATHAAAQPTTVNVSSTTLFAGAPIWRDGQSHTATPIMERVGFSTNGPDNAWFKDVKFNVLGWVLADPSVLSGERVFAGDVDLAYVQATVFDRRLSLRLGRQLVVGGVVRATSIDGLNTELMIWRGIGLAAYGGVPVVPRFAVARGDAIAGGRAFWRKSIDTEMGVSFIELLDHGLTSRRDLGVDARYAPSSVWAFNGLASWSLVEGRLAEGEVTARWEPRLNLQFLATYRRTSPDLFISRGSIFSVFAEEHRDEAGGGVFWKPERWIGLYADARALWVDGGNGVDAVGRATFNLGVSTLGAELRRLSEPVNGYSQARVWVVRPLSRTLSLSGDLSGFLFDHSINSVPRSISATGSANYAFAPGWRAVVSGVLGDTPFFSRSFEIIGRLAFDFSTQVGKVRL
jgi:hypothetical protein